MTSTTVQMGTTTIDPADGPFELRRHGGAASHHWRTVWRGASAESARTQYVNWQGTMRQGGVQLLAADGRVLAESHAPRLRTRW